jgi:release factor glutamine methyltransferase
MSIQKNPLTIVEILNRTSDYFKSKNIKHARLSAEWLLSHVLEIDRIQLYLQYDRVLTTAEINAYRNLIKRRALHEPLQYIVGETEFMGLKFKVYPAVLIPRPETELLVEKVLELREDMNELNPLIWDIGTGSGCIAISIANLWVGSKIIASDISDQALKIAQENVVLNKVESTVQLIKHDILSDDLPKELSDPDIIVSNPPYISAGEMKNLDEEVKSFEPRLALTDEYDGFIFYDRIFKLIQNGLKSKFILIELSGTQSSAIINRAEKLKVKDLQIFNDLNDTPRILQFKVM